MEANIVSEKTTGRWIGGLPKIGIRPVGLNKNE
jgi:hypothetical protein